MLQRKWTLGAISVLLAAALLAYLLLAPSEDLRIGSVALDDAPVAVGVRSPKSFRITYLEETRAGGHLTSSTEVVSVRRPFDAHVETRTGAPPGRKRVSVSVSAFSRTKTGDLVLASAPAPAPADRRVAAFVDEAVEDGYAQERERRRIAGRVCRVYRFPGAEESLSFAPVSKLDDRYTDVCVDEAGLVLEEVGVIDGRQLTRRLAVSVTEEPKLSSKLFDAGDPTMDARKGGGSVRQLEASSKPPGTFWELPAAPDGFDHEGRYSVVPPQTGFDDPTQRQQIVAFASDVWTDESDVIIIEQGATLGGTQPFADDPNAKKVKLGKLGDGELVYAFNPEVRVKLEGGSFVRVVGTVAPTRLLAVARSLVEEEGGTLVFLDEGPS